MAAAERVANEVRRDVVDYDLLLDCVHCGLCLEACPTYALTRSEMDSPRGRVHLMKSLADGRLELDADAVRHLDLCLGCRGCETACPSGVQYGRLIEGARDYVRRNYRRPLWDRIRRAFILALFPYPNRLRVMLAPLRAIDRMGLRPVMRRLTPPGLRDWIDLVPAAETIADNGAARDVAASAGAADGPAAVVHHGCVAQVLTPGANRNTERALTAAGYRVVQLARTECCGALDLHDGNMERAREFARRNVRVFGKSGAESIVSAASGCAAAIASYGEILKDDPELAASAKQMSARVTDVSALVLARGGPTGRLECTVTYHDSCHLAHGLKVREEPRKAIAAIAGVRLIELNESDLCCGSAGSYNLLERGMARDLARRKVDNIIATGADYVVLCNPGCEFQIGAELTRRNAHTRAIHLADFLALAARGAGSQPHAATDSATTDP